MSNRMTVRDLRSDSEGEETEHDDPEHDYTLDKVITLDLADDDHAQWLLNRVAKYLNILAQRHKWNIGELLEYLPKKESRSTLVLGKNVDMGREIHIRIRKPPESGNGARRGKRARDVMADARAASFYEFEEILCTGVHEITHCTITPHNKEFYALYDELIAEVEQIQLEEQAGEQRQTVVSGRVLGGGGTTGVSSLIGAPASSPVMGSTGGRPSLSAVAAVWRRSEEDCGTMPQQQPGGPWKCVFCTLENASSAEQCGACANPKGEVDREAHCGTWVCPTCTFQNGAKDTLCQMCGKEGSTSPQPVSRSSAPRASNPPPLLAAAPSSKVTAVDSSNGTTTGGARDGGGGALTPEERRKQAFEKRFGADVAVNTTTASVTLPTSKASTTFGVHK